MYRASTTSSTRAASSTRRQLRLLRCLAAAARRAGARTRHRGAGRTRRGRGGWRRRPAGRSGSSPLRQRVRRSYRQCGWREARIAVGSGDIGRPQVDVHVEARGHFGRTRLEESIWRAGPSAGEVELDALEEHRLTGVADAVDVLFGVDDVAAAASAMNPAVAATMPGWSGHESSRTDGHGAAFYRRRAKHATAVAAAALSESTPSAIGIRTGVASVEQRRRSARPARSRSGWPPRSPATTSSIDRRVGVGRQREQLRSRRGRAVRRRGGVVRAWGSANAVPIATRSDRRASGSALVWSRIRPSHPNAAALRMIEPTLTGLSTASRTTRRSADAASLGDASVEPAVRTAPRCGAGTRARSRPGARRCRRRRRDSRARRRAAARASMSTSAATGTQPAAERPLDHEVALGEEQPGAGVVALLGRDSPARAR